MSESKKYRKVYDRFKSFLLQSIFALIYKKANKIGYKTAKRRFKMELRNLAIAMIVVICDGNLNHFET